MEEYRKHQKGIILYGNLDRDLTVLDCEYCGFAHLVPIPDVEQYYKNDLFYKEHSPSDWFVKEIKEYTSGLWNAHYEHQRRLLPTHSSFPIMDIGCGIGTFVDYFESKHTLVFGIEPSYSARSASVVESRHFSIFKDMDAFFSEYPVAEMLDGLNIRMSLVLEHVPYPEGFLRSYIEYLGNGRLMIIVPNEYNPLQRRIKGDRWFVSNVHLNYFTPDSLRSLLEKVGLEVIYESSTFPMELFALMGFDYINNDVLGRKLHNFRLRLEKLFGHRIYRFYKFLYEKYGIGRELIFVARKK